MIRTLPQQYRSPGFAATSVLFAIGLLVLFGIASSKISQNTLKAKLFHETKEKMIAQVDLINNTLIMCRTVFPAGDNGSGNIERKFYPATPGDGLVASITCPGQGATSIWSGDYRSMAPRPLPGFSAWQYVNDATSLRIQISTANSGVAFYQDLLESVKKKIGEAAVRSGDTLTITLID